MGKKIKINDKLAVNTLRVLAAIAITRAKSGHPGGSLGAADILTYLYFEEIFHKRCCLYPI